MKDQHLPKVSVIVPAFNEEKYILRTLEALVSQDYPCYEIIIANNASTDRTAAIVQQFIDEDVTGIPVSLFLETRQGTNFARECARKKAVGSIIAQLDADCVPDTDWLRKGVHALCNHNKQRVAVSGPYDYFDGDPFLRTATLLSQQWLYPFVSAFVQLMGRGAILIGGNAFIRADVLERAGGYNTALTFYGDDADLGKKLARYGYVYYMPSLVQRSSSRRYKENGFWEVNKKYQSSFWDLVWNKGRFLSTMEKSHPR